MQLFSWRDAIDAAPVVGSLMAEELQWTSASARAAITRYAEKINHLLESAGLSYKRSPSSISQSAADATLGKEGSGRVEEQRAFQ